MKKSIKIFFNNNWSIILVLILCIFLSSAFISTKLIAGHDTEVHGVRLANYYLAIKQDQYPPQWAPNMNYGFGYPVFVYSYHLPYLIGLVPFVITNSVEQALNFVFIISIFLGAFGAYFLAKTHKKSNFVSFLASLVYALSPYFLLTIYIRGAVAEALFLGLLPVTFALIVKKGFSKFYEKLIFFLILCALLLSHHVALMVFLPLTAGWLVVSWKISQPNVHKSIVQKIIIVVSSILATAFYWIPALLGSSLIEVSGSRISAGNSGFLKISQLWWSLWDCQQFCYSSVLRPVPTFLGFASLFILTITLFALITKKIDKKYLDQAFFWVGISLITFFLMLSMSYFLWNTLPIIGMIEFPWLLLWVPTIASVFCLIYLEKLIFEKGLISLIIIGLIFGQSAFALLFWGHPDRYISKLSEDWFEFGDISQNYDGLLPKGFDSHKNLKLNENVVIRLDGSKTFDNIRQEEPNNQGKIEILEWTGTKMKYKVEASQSANVIQKTTYFPGWHSSVDNKTVENITDDIEFPGRVIIPILSGKHVIESVYKSDTNFQELGKFVSAIGILMFFGYSRIFKILHKIFI